MLILKSPRLGFCELQSPPASVSVLPALRPRVFPTGGDAGLIPVKVVPLGGISAEVPQRTKSFPAPLLSASAQAPLSPLSQGILFVPRNNLEFVFVPDLSETTTKAPGASVKEG